MRQLATGIVLFVALGFFGCGKESDSLGRRAVSGRVSLAGQPLAQGTITFDPVGKGTSSGAAITNGDYSLTAANGLPPGSYVVRISSPVGGIATPDVPGESDQLAKEQIPAEFNSQTNLKAEVTDAGPNTFNFDIPKAAE